jgi:hypothetical protein
MPAILFSSRSGPGAREARREASTVSMIVAAHNEAVIALEDANASSTTTRRTG